VAAVTSYFARRSADPQVVADLTADTFVTAITHVLIDAERAGRALVTGLGALPDRDRALVELVDLAGLRPKEAAAVLGVTPGAVRMRLMREHGPALANPGPPAHPARHFTASPVKVRRTLLAGGGILVVAAAIAGTLVAGSGTPAYAVTKNPDGTITLAVYQQSGIAPANARLRQLGAKQVVVVPVEAGCPKPPPPAVSVHGVRISVRSGASRDGSVTVNAQGIPAGDILVVGMQASGHNRNEVGIVTSPPAPDCISPPAPPDH
jgi:Fe2+ transport system protein FeoA